MSHEQAMVAPVKRQICAGQLGKRCSCGLYHATGGMTVDRGIQTDHAELPITLEDEPAGGLVLAILGVLSSLGLVLLAWLVYTAWRWFL